MSPADLQREVATMALSSLSALGLGIGVSIR
jgi:hypothetical protein